MSFFPEFNLPTPSPASLAVLLRGTQSLSTASFLVLCPNGLAGTKSWHLKAEVKDKNNNVYFPQSEPLIS